jgi:hypothetical protein
MKDTYRTPAAALRGEVVNLTLASKIDAPLEPSSVKGTNPGGSGLSFGL